jgi:hypothetical protein
VTSASILYEVPEKGRDPESETDQDEEWETSYSGRMS